VAHGICISRPRGATLLFSYVFLPFEALLPRLLKQCQLSNGSGRRCDRSSPCPRA
jgi:hypothetical protein